MARSAQLRTIRATDPDDPAMPSTPAIRRALDALVPSSDPSIVLSSLARASVPSLSTTCTVRLSQGTEPVFDVSYPLAAGDVPPSVDRGGTSSGGSVVTLFQGPAAQGAPSFDGVVIHSWSGRKPALADSVVWQLLVSQAVAVVAYQRLAEQLATADERAGLLALELITSGIEGRAVGILMATSGTTDARSRTLLRQASRRTGRSVTEVASDVLRTRGLTAASTSPDRRRDRLTLLRSADADVGDDERACADASARPPT
jgi:hypothetical protein